MGCRYYLLREADRLGRVRGELQLHLVESGAGEGRELKELVEVLERLQGVSADLRRVALAGWPPAPWEGAEK